MIAANGRGLPSGVVARRVCRVELEFVVFVISSEKEGCSEGSATSHLSVVLFDVAYVDNDLFDRDARPELEAVVLSVPTCTCAYSRKMPIR